MNKNTFTYLRKASKNRDGMNGVLYHHSWGTGGQELVFPDDAAAQRWWSGELDRLATNAQASASYAYTA